ncbi:MAG: primase-like protein [Verrucomicrobiales bacterium]|nr:primase-like protein [Verrucomicrobiales bacterium]
MGSSEKSTLQVGKKSIPVSNLEKVLYPKCGFTKGQVIDYYIRIAPVLLPHLKARPLTLKRYPNGVEQPFFYEKKCPSHRPPWVDTAAVWSEGNQANINFCLANDLPTLVWAANLADLELHTSLARAPKYDSPTMVVFDLDPGLPANIVDCCEVAFALREELTAFKLEAFPKTSGSKGLQIYIPLNSPTSYDLTKTFAHGMAETLEGKMRGKVVSKMAKALRNGKVFVDWSQNDIHKTTVCVYSLRAKDSPTVSTPVTWDEVGECLKKKKPDILRFESEETLRRVGKHGDLFEPVLKKKQKLKG